MPRHFRITQLMIEWCQNQITHAGRGMRINAVGTSGYWVINCNAAVRSTTSECVRCKILRGKFQQQQMANLPKDRISEEAPFSYCGIDMFWTFYRQGWLQGKEKLWCIICLPFIKSCAY